MEIVYSSHLINRLNLRKVDPRLPRKIFEESDERYYDKETEHYIAILKTKMYNKIRDIMVAYVMEKNCVRLLTIHPLKERQKANRVRSERWRKI